MKGIDVSHWQGDINWPSVKEAGIDFAIIKAGGSDAGFYKDSKFEQNYEGAKASGINVGSYYYVGSKCTSYAAGVADANRFIQLIKGKTFEYPVYIDLESTQMSDKVGATDACVGFCKTMEDADYYCGIYASDIYGFKDRLELNKLSLYSKWVARYGSRPTYVAQYGMWQSSDSGKVNGINGNVDMDEAYIDFPTHIKNAGLNGFKKEYIPIGEPESNDLQEENEKLRGKIKRIMDIINE